VIFLTCDVRLRPGRLAAPQRADGGRAGYNVTMTADRTRDRDHGRDLVSDPSAERLADAVPDPVLLAAADARSGGDASRAPRSLTSTELEPDDEAIASNEDWDDPSRL
jgi:hypothetical protein